MIGTLIGIIFVLILAGVLFWAAQTLIALIPLAEPFKTIIRVLLILIGVVIVLYVLQMILQMFGVSVPFPRLR
jgi:uncharacterized membrane protein YwzB